MTTITLSLDDTKVEKLKEMADSYGLQLEQFLSASIKDMISHEEPEFTEALKKVLNKNKDLYMRLA